MKKIFFIAALMLLIINLNAQTSENDGYVISSENNALNLVEPFGDVLRGTGYAPEVNFIYVRNVYRDSILNNSKNPFIYAAYGFTFHYKDDIDSSTYYFRKANQKSDLNYINYMRLIELYNDNGAYYIIRESLEGLVNMRYKLGAVSMPEAALYLNQAAISEYNDKGNIELAEQYFIFANAIDPFNMGIAANLLKLSMIEMRFENMSLIIKMFRQAFLDIFNKFVLLFNLIVFLRYVIFASFLIMTILLFIKNFNEIYYIIYNNLTAKLTDFQKKIIFVLILVFPLLLEIHPFIWIFYLSIIIFFFIRRREKILLGMLMLLIALMPVFFYIENHIQGKMNADDNLTVIVKANYSGYDSKLVETIDELITEQPFNNALFFAKGILFKKGGFYSQSEEEYNKILLTGEMSGEVYNNMGNLMFFIGLYQKAEDYYNRAIEIAPKLPQPYYNMAQLQIQRLNLNLANEYMEKASAINNDLINNFMDNTVENYHNTELIDCTVPESYLWEEFTKRNKITNSPVIMGMKIDILMYIAIISLILSGILGSTFKHKMHLRTCYTCGKPVFLHRMKEFNEQKICDKCFGILDSTVSDSLRARKYESIMRVREKSSIKTAKILSFVFPGAGKIFKEKLAKGFLLLFVIISMITLLFSGNIFIVRNPHLLNTVYFENNYLIAGILGLIYMINIAVMRKGK